MRKFNPNLIRREDGNTNAKITTFVLELVFLKPQIPREMFKKHRSDQEFDFEVDRST